MKYKYDVLRQILVVEGAKKPPATEADTKPKPARRKARKVQNKAAKPEDKAEEADEK